MKIVIDISEDDFGCIYDRYADGDSPDEKSLTDTVMYAIANGIVLPKGHGDLVDGGKVVDIVTEYVPDDDGSVGNTNLKDLLYEVENMERVIEADREDT